MSVMADSFPPALSADAIRDAFLADAEAAAKQVVGVGEALQSYQGLREQLDAAFAEYESAWTAAQRNPVVAAKLSELNLPSPDVLAGGASRGRRSAKPATKRSARKRPGNSDRAQSTPAGAAAPGVGTGETSSTESVPQTDSHA